VCGLMQWENQQQTCGKKNVEAPAECGCRPNRHRRIACERSFHASSLKCLVRTENDHSSGRTTVAIRRGFQEVAKRIGITQRFSYWNKPDPFGVMAILNGPNLYYAGS
jgi:hypothetical protein